MNINPKFVLLVLLLIFIPCFFLAKNPLFSAPNEKVIYYIPITGTIDLGLSAFIQRTISEIKKQKISAVVFSVNTFGGRVDAADEIVTAIQEISSIPTYAYITNSAWSAGALISLSCKTIIMKAGSSIGSAEPRALVCCSELKNQDEKIISALRAKFKATAEINNHSANLAQAMVDKNIELYQITLDEQEIILTNEELEQKKSQYPAEKFKNKKLISSSGKLLNLTANEAYQLKLAALIVNSDEDFFKHITSQFSPQEKPQIIRPAPNWSENLVRFITHPIASSLLISLGFLGLLFELKIPGWGLSGTLGALFIILFFWGHYLAGLANWVDILIFVIGLILLLIELLFIPGFGIFGISGIILAVSGLILTLVKYPFKFPYLELSSAFYIIASAFVSTLAITALSFKLIPRTNFWGKILLKTTENKNLGFQTKSLSENICVGKIGISKTILRPTGRAFFDDELVDVISVGEFIDTAQKIKIIKIEGNKIFVEQIKEQ